MIQRGMLEVLRSAVSAHAKLRDVVRQWRASTEKGRFGCVHVTLGPSFLPCPHPDCAGRVLREVRIPRWPTVPEGFLEGQEIQLQPPTLSLPMVEIAEAWRVERVVLNGELLYGWRRVR